MYRVGIIGTAGRGASYKLLNESLYWLMLNHIAKILEADGVTRFRAVSGGAAWMDHLAVSLFLRGVADELELHLPARFDFKRHRFAEKSDRSPGNIANYYHDRFTAKMDSFKARRGDPHTLKALSKAHEMGAEFFYYSGFKRRNLEVGKVNLLIAGTFGTQSGTYGPEDNGWAFPAAGGLKDGGTAHTWEYSSATTKIHTNLHELR